MIDGVHGRDVAPRVRTTWLHKMKYLLHGKVHAFASVVCGNSKVSDKRALNFRGHGKRPATPRLGDVAQSDDGVPDLFS